VKFCVYKILTSFLFTMINKSDSDRKKTLSMLNESHM